MQFLLSKLRGCELPESWGQSPCGAGETTNPRRVTGGGDVKRKSDLTLTDTHIAAGAVNFLPKCLAVTEKTAIFAFRNQQRKIRMPEICRFYGIVITMYQPGHNPPHFHVRYNEYRATIDIQTGEVTGQIPRRALNLVFEWLDQHKDELMENWKRMENGETLATINPLD